jgi:hypothetical protein
MTWSADEILREQGAMETERSAYEAEWRDVAALLLPREAGLLSGTALSGFNSRPQLERIFDETARQSLQHGCEVFEGEVIPQGGVWQKFRARDDELMKIRRCALWYEALGTRLFALRNSPYSGFALQTHQSVKSLLGFGNQGMWVDKLRDARGMPVGLSYQSEHVGQLYVREDAQGRVVRTHRKFSLTAQQASDKWGEAAPECVRKAMAGPNPSPNSTHEYLHVLRPNRAYEPERIDVAGKRIAACYLSIADRQVFAEGGYRTMRLTYSRYEKVQTQPYGSGPFMDVLPSVRACQAMMRDLITAIEFMAKPALGAHDDMLDQILMYSPGGVTYGAIDGRGQKLIQQLWDNPDIAPALQLLKDTRDIIKRAGFEDLYIARQELKSHISAAEQILRDQQRGMLLGPFKRQEVEWFTPQGDVELDLMAEMGMLDDMPPEVVEAGGLFQTDYDNPLTRARDAGEAGGFYQMLNGVTPLMQLDPGHTVPEFFKVYPFPRIVENLGRVHGVPVGWSASDEERAAADEEARAQAEGASLLDVGERSAAIAKDLAQAGAAGGLSGA